MILDIECISVDIRSRTYHHRNRKKADTLFNKKENFVYVHIPDISVYLCTDFDCGSVQTG